MFCASSNFDARIMSQGDTAIWILGNVFCSHCAGTGKLEGSDTDKPVKRALTININYLDFLLTTCTLHEPVCFSPASQKIISRKQAQSELTRCCQLSCKGHLGRLQCKLLVVVVTEPLQLVWQLSPCVLLCGRVCDVTQAERYQGLFLSCVWYRKNVEDIYHH